MSRSIVLILVGMIGWAPLLAIAEEPAQEQDLHVDRTNWFQIEIPKAWKKVEPPTAGVLTLRPAEGTASISMGLQIRQVTAIEEYSTREELLGIARQLIDTVRPDDARLAVHEIQGWPMTGLSAEISDPPRPRRRVTVLLDPPRHRAFIWTASAAEEEFPQYDALFDQVASQLVPALADGS